jgi:hypothetical protein
MSWTWAAALSVILGARGSISAHAGGEGYRPPSNFLAVRTRRPPPPFEEHCRLSEQPSSRDHVCRNRLFCDAPINADAIATGIIRNWVSDDEHRDDLSVQVARGLLNEDGSCAASKELSEEISGILPEAIKVRSSPTEESPQN